MPRYLIERNFEEGLSLPGAPHGGDACRVIAERNAHAEVTWLHSYVSADHRTTFCIYDGPTPEAVRRAAALNHLPVDSITEISVLDPYFYSAP
jgi:hypothetical protein